MLNYALHDAPLPPGDAAAVDAGLGAANESAAPLELVQPLACFARLDDATLVGGAVGRTWGACCELQQLWVEPAWRRRGIATELVQRFERHASARGCSIFYLETFSFQAPRLYGGLGYAVAAETAGFPNGIVKFLMKKTASAATPSTSA